MKHEQTLSQMILITANKKDELRHILDSSKTVSFIEVEPEDTTTPEEEAELTYVYNQKRVTPFRTYCQQHNRYHEVNISGKTEQEVYEEVCEVIEGM